MSIIYGRIIFVIDSSESLRLAVSGKAFPSWTGPLMHGSRTFEHILFSFSVEGVYSLLVTAVNQGLCGDLS